MHRAPFTASSLRAGSNEEGHQRHRYWGGETSPTCRWIAVSPGRPAKLHLTPPLSAFTLNKLPLCNLCSTCASPLSPPTLPGAFPLQCLKPGERSDLQGERLWGERVGLLLCTRRLCRCYLKHVFGENKEDFPFSWCCVCVLEEDRLDSGVQDVVATDVITCRKWQLQLQGFKIITTVRCVD